MVVDFDAKQLRVYTVVIGCA